MENSTRFFSILSISAFLILSACSSAPKDMRGDAKTLQKEICAQRSDLTEVTGTMWLKVQSREANGQFPAVVSATPQNLKLEVTNLVGGREALVEVVGAKYTIEHQGNRTTGKSSWGGIPLQWSIPLFMGKVPCFNVTPTSGARVAWNDKDELVVQRTIPNLANDLETMVYRFQDWGGKQWVNYLRWEIKSTKKTQVVEFEFFEPDMKTGWAKRITAKSERGEVQVRWKDWNLKSPNAESPPSENTSPAVTD